MREFHCKGFIVAIGALLFCEIGVRFGSAYISGNVKQIGRSSDIAARMQQRPMPTLLLLGNSLIGEGVDPRQLSALLNGVDPMATPQPLDSSPAAVKLAVEKYVPDATEIWDWYYILRERFITKNASPKILVVGYAWNQLEDQSRLEVSRLFRFFAPLRAIPEIAEIVGYQAFSIGEGVVARTSLLYAMRNEVKNRVLDLVVPDYREMVQRLNAGGAAPGRPVDADSSASPQSPTKAPTTLLLEKFTQMLTAHGIKLVLVRMPVNETYEPSNAMKLFCAEHPEVVCIDARTVPGIDASRYQDTIHLSESGSTTFTRHLALELQAKLAGVTDAF